MTSPTKRAKAKANTDRRRAPRRIRPVAAPGSRPPALEGVWAATDTRLDDRQLFPLPSGFGPEDVVVDGAGRVVSGDAEGRLWRWPAAARPEHPPALLATTGGRPLGIEYDAHDDTLVVCDAYRGLLRVADDGRVTTLCTDVGGRSMVLCNNAVIARDGTIYFTDSSDRYPLSAYKRDLLEHRPNGRVLGYDAASKKTEVVAEGLYFPNGIVLTPDESALLVVETGTYRMSRIPLATGRPEVLVEFPAFPDNMCAAGDGTYWIAFPSPRLAIAERLLPYPRLRYLAALMPDRLQPRPTRHSIVAQVTGTGEVLRTLHGPAGRYSMLTGVRPYRDALWLGSLTERGVAMVPL